MRFPETPTPEKLGKMAKYLSEQYQVRYYGQDITTAFFSDLTNPAKNNLTACTTKRQAIVTEDFFVNRREANFMQMFFGVRQDDYNYYFREGFQRGYEDGYYGRRTYGTNANGSDSLLGTVLNMILNLQPLQQ